MPTPAQALAASLPPKATPGADRALPCCELFGYGKFILAGDFLTIAVMTSGGSLHTHGIRASRRVWRDLAARILAETGDPGGHALAAPARRGGRILTPEVRAAYLRVWTEWKTRRHPSLAAACRANEVPYQAAQAWLRLNATTLASAAAALPAPVLKPGGRIL